MHHSRCSRVFNVRTSSPRNPAVPCLTASESSLYGLTVLQTYIYYRESVKEPMTVKILVCAPPNMPSICHHCTYHVHFERKPPRSRSFGELPALLQFLCKLSHARSFFDTAATVTITIGAWIFFVQDFGKQAPMPVVKDPPYVLVPSACVLFLKINFFNPAEPWPYASVLFRLSFSSGLTLSLR